MDEIIKRMGCSDPEHTQDDGDCFCNECSMGENPTECEKFREKNKLVLMEAEYSRKY